MPYRLKFFDRQGEPLSDERWIKLFSNMEYSRVRRTQLPGDVNVSTVWLGMDHGFSGRREIFETMVFGGDDAGDCERYSTEDQAVAGHDRWVAKMRRAGLRLAN